MATCFFTKWPHLSLQSVHSVSPESVHSADFKAFWGSGNAFRTVDRIMSRKETLVAVSAWKRQGVPPLSYQYLLSFFGDVLEVVMCFCCAKGTYQGIGMAGFRLRWIQLGWEAAKKRKPWSGWTVWNETGWILLLKYTEYSLKGNQPSKSETRMSLLTEFYLT